MNPFSATARPLPATARAVLVPLCGVALAAAYPPLNWNGWLVPALALFFGLSISARSPRRALFEGFLTGFVFFSLLLRWFGAALVEFSSLGGLIALAAVLVSGIILGVGTGLVSWAGNRLQRRWGLAAAVVGLPALWCGFELSRAVFPFPFPWATLSAALAEEPATQQAVRVLGAFGLSWLTASTAASLVGIWRGSARRYGLFAVAAAATALLASWLAPNPAPSSEVTVAVVQGALARGMDNVTRLETYEHLTREAAAAGAELIVWPESAVRYRVDSHLRYRSRLEALTDELDVDLLVGSVTNAPSGAFFNSAVLIRPRLGVSTISPKRQLVPFGEYLPGRWILGNVPALAAEAGDFEPGRDLVLHPSRIGRAGSLVCYEAVFPGLARELALRGADLLVNMTNDSWFGWTSGPRQHLQHSLLRSAETGLPMLRAANTGISVIVDGDGSVIAEQGLGVPGALVAKVGLGRPRPWGLAVGAALSWACAILALVFVAAAFVPLNSPGTELPVPDRNSRTTDLRQAVEGQDDEG